MSDVALTRVGLVAVLEIQRPPTNFFDHDLLRELADRCEELQAETDTCHAIVIASQGKHFCAGADFGSRELTVDRNAEASRIYSEGIRLFSIELPVVAAVQGAAVGGGLGLACAADFRVASSTTRFHANFATLGFHHGFGLTVTLPRLVGPQRAKDLLLTARPVAGEEALSIGLVDRITEPGEERAGAIALATAIAAAGPLAVRSMKRTLAGSVSNDVEAALQHELSEQSWLWRTPDSQERVRASLERRPKQR